MLLAVTCPICDARGHAPCQRCAAALRPAPDLDPPPGVDQCLALLAYEGAGRELVARLKYRNNRTALPGLVAAMASLVDDPSTLGVVTWAPTTRRRRRQRGFDQAELLARGVARRLGCPCRRLLLRLPGQPQTGASRVERQRAPHLRPRHAIPGASVLVVDDVVTTGATLSAAAGALRQAGATRVVALAAARTPKPGLH